MNLLGDQTSAAPALKPESIADPRILHAQALKSSRVDRSIFNNLITLYAKSNLLDSSLRVFKQIPSPNIVSWTSLISVHSSSPLSLTLFLSMLRHPILPNQRTLASLFKACVSLPRCLFFGLSLHALSFKLSLNAQPFSGSALVNFYSKYRLPIDARKVFDEMRERDEVCYAAVIVGLAQNSKPLESLSLFAAMKSSNVSSTMYSVSGALRAVADLAALEQCRMIHGHAVVTGFDKNVIVGSALVDGYGKSGLVSDARKVFDENIAVMNIVGWNALMAGYAQQGDSSSVIKLFQSMANVRFVPDEYSFLAALSGFYNAGLVGQSEIWLKRMKLEYGIEPGLEHYTCLIGALGKAGRLEDAERIATTMPFNPDAAVWRSLMSSCAHHGAADMALRMARRSLELDPNDDSAYTIAANVLSFAGRWSEVADMRKLMKDRRVKKEVGKSWIEVKGEVHMFMAGDRKHERTEEIYEKLAELMESIEKLGYKPVWDEMLHEVGKGEKKEALWYHSEKLALAYGIVSGAAPAGKPMRIVKNLRICKDCHEAFKYISRAIDKEIILSQVKPDFKEMYPRVKVKEQDQDDQQVIKDSVLSLKDVLFLSMLDSYFPGKKHEDDVSPIPTARIPKSYHAPEVDKHSDSTSEEAEQNKTKAEEEETRPNIRVSSTPRPRAVISSPDNDALIRNKNKIKGRQRTASKNHNTVQNRHTTRTHIFGKSPVKTNKSNDGGGDNCNVEIRGKKGSRPTVSSQRKHLITQRPGWQDP
ncbi:hypothetical protein ES288_A02G052000v1 [Gossypium darwinii]|uniref:DYW domain-containing protein n=1 Tax=Gossypium darwinii TaxID=34276 RepID=A0A5D2HCC4_GOSDA|nr:hypothetical protein ES288_A02G052000v1 [Gossypium darwinii]